MSAKEITAALEALRAEKLAALEAQVEALKTMPEGTEFLDGFTMTERRRARYIRDGEQCLAVARALPLNLWTQYRNTDLLFCDDLMPD